MKLLQKLIFLLLIVSLALYVLACEFSKVTLTPMPTSTHASTTAKSIEKTPVDELIIILHAGGSFQGVTHLNAQETFEYYYNQGYRYFEYDLRLSSDGRIIATHAWEHLNVTNTNPTYEEFKSLRLDNGFTPANEEWLIETIKKYPDVNFIIDAKMDSTEGDSAVLARLEALEDIYNVDISPNIIPEIFSIEMWNIVKQQTTFDRYLFSHYKVYYTVDTMLEHFSDDRIWGFALPTYTDSDIRSRLSEVKETKVIFVFTPTSKNGVEDAIEMGADGVYLDDVSLIE